jgi:hypothetical protein
VIGNLVSPLLVDYGASLKPIGEHMPNFREIFSAPGQFEIFVALLGKASGPMPMFGLLDDREKPDVLEGRCLYSEYNAVPMLDYRKSDGVVFQRLNFGDLP